MKSCTAVIVIVLLIGIAGCLIESQPDEPCHSEMRGAGTIRIIQNGSETIVQPDDGSVFIPIEDDAPPVPVDEDTYTRVDPDQLQISLDDACMQEVVREFTRISGANIIASPSNLRGRVTANLMDVGWQSALETILDMHGLALIESPPRSKIFRIDPKVPGAPEPMKTQVYHLNDAHETTEVANALEKTMGSGTGFSVGAVPSRNCIIVNATASYHYILEEIMDALDNGAMK